MYILNHYELKKRRIAEISRYIKIKINNFNNLCMINYTLVYYLINIKGENTL